MVNTWLIMIPLMSIYTVITWLVVNLLMVICGCSLRSHSEIFGLLLQPSEILSTSYPCSDWFSSIGEPVQTGKWMCANWSKSPWDPIDLQSSCLMSLVVASFTPLSGHQTRPWTKDDKRVWMSKEISIASVRKMIVSIIFGRVPNQNSTWRDQLPDVHVHFQYYGNMMEYKFEKIYHVATYTYINICT